MTEQQDLIGMPVGQEALDMIDRGAMDLPDARWAPALANMVAVLDATFRRAGVEADQAARLATAGVLAQAEYAGGRMMYLPRGERLRLALRDAEIYLRAKRGNIPELASEYQLSDIHIYRICREQRALHLAKVQGRFNFGEME